MLKLITIIYKCNTEEAFLLRFSSNSEAKASELLVNLEEMFPVTDNKA